MANSFMYDAIDAAVKANESMYNAEARCVEKFTQQLADLNLQNALSDVKTVSSEKFYTNSKRGTLFTHQSMEKQTDLLQGKGQTSTLTTN